MGCYEVLAVLFERGIYGKKRSEWRNIAEIWAVTARLLCCLNADLTGKTLEMA